ncbi:hypothetical protein C0J52_01976 [Blattella germanica]|nr:hypothetical protein C0J52_01976 [Blattella germanica]
MGLAARHYTEKMASLRCILCIVALIFVMGQAQPLLTCIKSCHGQYCSVQCCLEVFNHRYCNTLPLDEICN